MEGLGLEGIREEGGGGGLCWKGAMPNEAPINPG